MSSSRLQHTTGGDLKACRASQPRTYVPKQNPVNESPPRSHLPTHAHTQEVEGTQASTRQESPAPRVSGPDCHHFCLKQRQHTVSTHTNTTAALVTPTPAVPHDTWSG